MAYTSSALSFILEDLGKTVVTALSLLSSPLLTYFSQILTGAQIPLSQLRNDAVDNLMGALTIAGHYIIPGTCQVSLSFPHILTKIFIRVLSVF